ncbi:hypothetical protein IAR55_002462 [Kwoniella newhampshirensis]|uniref:Ribosomal RNA-processing protein 14/surfeit locus protein 6 C-terminal domain-containing protein n=1 Tax=Kwoniella newhampshirensis TaxID=1651941 RepID=A0AAW0YSQ0_9TREE
MSSPPPISAPAPALAPTPTPTRASSSNAKLSAKGRRKAGGPGKKGKVFVEDKSSLLSLMSQITKSKETIVQSKVAKTRASLTDAEAVETKKGKHAGLGNEKKRVEREKAINQAKAALLEKAREKRRRKQQAASGQAFDKTDKPVKKRVGFA